MGSRRHWIVVFLGVLALLAVWMLWAPGGYGPNEARYRALAHDGRTAYWLQRANTVLPSGFAKFVRLPALEAHYMGRYESDRKRLLASGYLVEVPITVTNLAGQFAQTQSRIRNALNGRDAYWTARFQVRSNLVTVTCRQQDAPFCKKAFD